MIKKRFYFFASILIFLSVGRAYAFSEDFFSDVDPENEFYMTIQALKSRGLIKGYSDGTFKPNQKVNRAEALTLVLRGASIDFENEKCEKNPFPDVPKDSWFCPMVKVGVERKIVKGYEDGTFRPEVNVNRAEILAMFFLASEVEIPEKVQNNFSDIDDDVWYTPLANLALEKNYFEFTGKNFSPGKDLTRGEVARLSFRNIFSKENELQKFTDSFSGKVSYYADMFEGRKTASGEVFWQNHFSAANRLINNGTVCRACGVKGCVIFKINDYGPALEDRALDFSKSTFESVANLSSGVTDVDFWVLAEIPDFEKRYYSEDFFERIVLDRKLPNIFLENETYKIQGKAEKSNSLLTVFIINEDESQESFEAKTDKNGYFSKNIDFSDSGNKNLGIILDDNNKSIIASLNVIKKDFSNKGVVSLEMQKPENLTASFLDNKAFLSWRDDSDENTKLIYKVEFWQNKKTATYYLNGANSFSPPRKNLIDFSEGYAKWRAGKAEISTDFSIDRSSEYVFSDWQDINISMHSYGYKDEEKVFLKKFPERVRINQKVEIEGEAYVESLSDEMIILNPNGEIEEVIMDEENQNGKIYFSADFLPKVRGAYIVEVMESDGNPILNYPIYTDESIPLLPDFSDINQSSFSDPNLQLSYFREKMLAWINTDRKKYGLEPLALDSKLNNLAQSRSQDMAKRNYFSHINPDGESANTLKDNFGILQNVAENIGQNPDVYDGYMRLFRSPSHRKNILDKDAEIIGIGVFYDMQEEGFFITQIFSEKSFNSLDYKKEAEEILSEINKKRSNKLSLDLELTQVCQSWADKMSEEDFFSNTSPSGESVQDKIREVLPNEAFEMFLVGGNSFTSTKENVIKSESAYHEKWTKFGIGFSQKEDGTIYTFSVFSE